MALFKTIKWMQTLVCHLFQGSGGGEWEPQARVKLELAVPGMSFLWGFGGDGRDYQPARVEPLAAKMWIMG